MEPKRELIRAAALALRIKGLRPETIYKMAREGKLPHYKSGAKGRAVLFDPTEVLAAMRKG